MIADIEKEGHTCFLEEVISSRLLGAVTVVMPLPEERSDEDSG